MIVVFLYHWPETTRTKQINLKRARRRVNTMTTRHCVTPRDLSQWTMQQRLELVKQYGCHPLAYATLQTNSSGEPILEYFDTSDGYVAFARTSSLGLRIVALGDPVCTAHKVKTLLAEFIRAHPRAAFVQVGETTGRHLEQLGFFVNRFGTETILDLDSFSLRGRCHEDIRTMVNVAERNGVKILGQRDVNVAKCDIERIDSEWIASRRVRTRELRFMVRPAIHSIEPMVRKLYAFAADRLVGFAYYDPMFNNGKLIGYHAMTNRFGSEAPKGTSYMLDITMVGLLQKEALPHFALGFSPFSQVNAGEPLRYNWITKMSFGFDYTCLNALYNFKGQEMRKRKYRGRVVPLYFASKGRFVQPIANLLAVCRVSNFSIATQILQQLRFG